MLAEKVNENIGAQVINMPKKEPYTQVLNIILTKLYSPGYHLPGEQRAVFDFILRQTSGYRRESDQISLSQFSETLGIKKPSVIRSIKALALKKIIIVSKIANEEAKVFRINTNIEEWLSLAEWLTLAKPLKAVSEIAKKPLAKLLPTKEIYKENLKERIPPLIPPQGNDDSETQKVKKLSCLSKPQIEKFKSFWEAYPKHRRKEKPQAERAFKEINPDEDLFAAMMSGLEAAVKSQDWQKEGGRYVCYPERFLKKKKWLDEYEDSKGFKKAGCPMSNYMPPADLKAEADKYANTLPDNPEDWF